MSEFPEYHKINSIQKRHIDGPSKGQFTGEWVDPVFEYLQDLQWVWREKIDGTNIRIRFNADSYEVGGRTNNAQIPATLIERLKAYPLSELPPRLEEVRLELTLYGEGFGAGIQKGGAYGPVDFILYDVMIHGFWLDQENVDDVAAQLGMQSVGWTNGTLREAIHRVRKGEFHSAFYEGPAEGIVAVPCVPLFNKWGERVIVKIKGKDLSAPPVGTQE